MLPESDRRPFLRQVNTVNEYGLTPLMLACIRGDEPMVNMLLDAGADVDAETPPTGPAYLMANPETQHWTALTYAAIHGHINLAKTLLEKNANVEGGARLAEEKCTETPLQVRRGGLLVLPCSVWGGGFVLTEKLSKFVISFGKGN